MYMDARYQSYRVRTTDFAGNPKARIMDEWFDED